MTYRPALQRWPRRLRSVRRLAIVELLEPRALLTTVNVTVENFDFNPATVTINVGDTVHWVFTSTHSTTSVVGSIEMWDSGVLNAGATFDHTFTHAGTIVYYCTLHGHDNGNGTASGMSGTVIVQAGNPNPNPNPNPVPSLTATGLMFNATVHKRFRGVVAKFTEAGTKTKSFHASINWGDGSASSSGRIKTLGGGNFAVVGIHKFGSAGTFMGTVSISDRAGNDAGAGIMAMVV
jgi:plastocyanin